MPSEGVSRGPHNLGEHTPGMGSKQEQRPAQERKVDKLTVFSFVYSSPAF